MHSLWSLVPFVLKKQTASRLSAAAWENRSNQQTTLYEPRRISLRLQVRLPCPDTVRSAALALESAANQGAARMFQLEGARNISFLGHAASSSTWPIQRSRVSAGAGGPSA